MAIGGFSLEMKEPKLHQLGVFWAKYGKKHPIWIKLGAFLSKRVYWWVKISTDTVDNVADNAINLF